MGSCVRTGACYNLRGESRAQLGDLVGAFQDLDHSVELMPAVGEKGWGAPGHIATFVNRSNCYKKVGRYAAAIADLRKALKLDPKHKQATKALCTSHTHTHTHTHTHRHAHRHGRFADGTPHNFTE